jgi:hypothetical protein
MRAIADSPDQVQIMHGVGGERWLPELSVTLDTKNLRQFGLAMPHPHRRKSMSSARSSTQCFRR